MLDFVGVLFRVGVNTLHALALGSTGDTALGSVDVVVDAVQETDGDDSGNALEECPDVAQLVDLACAHGVVAKEAHGPAQGATALEQLRVVLGLGLSHDLLVGELVGLG